MAAKNWLKYQLIAVWLQALNAVMLYQTTRTVTIWKPRYFFVGTLLMSGCSSLLVIVRFSQFAIAPFVFVLLIWLNFIGIMCYYNDFSKRAAMLMEAVLCYAMLMLIWQQQGWRNKVYSRSVDQINLVKARTTEDHLGMLHCARCL